MADNVNVTPGSGTIIATHQEISDNAQLQRVVPNTWNAGVATDVNAANPLPVTGTIKDGTSANLATVAVFHNADNQSPGGFSFGLLTGGVAQLINITGNLDRQRETGADNVPALGVATGTQQLASPFATTIAANISTGSQTVTPAAMSGTSRGSPWSIQVGSVLVVANSNGSNKETVVVTAVASTTFTALFASTKTGPGITVNGFVYNQAKDATAPDGTIGGGFAAGATYLFNSQLNSQAGGWESERSAAGELDGASGTGTNIAAEYEHNSGGPALTSGLASGLQFDRGRNVQGKGLATATITAPVNGNTSIVVPTPAQVNLLQPGAPLYLVTGGAIIEVVYVSQTYTPGTSPIALQNPVVTGGETTAWFDVFVPAGPGLAGFTPSGVEIAEEAIWDPASGKFYLARSATQDAVSGQNVVLESHGLYNGATMDRQRGNLDGVALVPSAAYTTTQTGTDQTNFNHRGVIVALNVTVPGTGSITLEIDMKDPVSGVYVALLTGAAVTTATTNLYTVYPGGPATANVSANAPLPRTWRVKVVANNANTITYSVGASLIV